MQSHPLGFGDVSRRIVRRRRRTASVATAAVAPRRWPGSGGRSPGPEPDRLQAVGAPWTTAAFGATTAVRHVGVPSLWRCEGPVPQTTTLCPPTAWSYFEYCEVLGVTATTVEMPMPTTTVSAIDLTTLLDQVLFVDASGDLDMGMTLIGQLGAPPRHLVAATCTVEQTMAMPTGADVSAAYEISGRLGIGGFDTWTPDLIDGELPDGIVVVIVIGEDWFDRTMPPQTTIVRDDRVDRRPHHDVDRDGGDLPTTTPLPPMTTVLLPPTTEC